MVYYRDRRCSLFNSASPGRHCESRAQLDEYVKELGGSHRKTDKLVDILVNSPWFPKTPNLSWQGGVTVLHAAVELGELKGERHRMNVHGTSKLFCKSFGVDANSQAGQAHHPRSCSIEHKICQC